MSVRNFFGWFLMTLGGLTTILAGGCGLLFASSAGGLPFALFILGALWFWGVLFIGCRMIRRGQALISKDED